MKTHVDVDLYHRQGYLMGFEVFPPENSGRLMALYHRLRGLLPAGASTQAMDWWHQLDRELYELMAHPAILDHVEPILGPDFYLWGSQFFSKDPGDGKAVPWHQDAFFWPLAPHKTVTVWLAFTETDEANGAMKVVPGSHRSGRLRHIDSDYAGDVLNMMLEDGSFRESDAIHLKLKPGQISLHDDNIVHGSDPNRTTDRLRCGLTMRYSAGEVKCDTSVWPYFKAYWMRGTDRWGHNPVGEPPTEPMTQYAEVTQLTGQRT